MHLSQLQECIGRWHSHIFGPYFVPTESHATLADHVTDKILEECEELLERHDCRNEIHEIGGECADVAIALMAYCTQRGIDLETEILKKHAINLRRKWTFDGQKFIREDK